MRNPLALLATRLRPPVAVVTAARQPPVAPLALPGYKPPERMTALDYLTPRACWPLVWLLDISGYDAVSHRASGQAAFALSGAHEGRAQVRLQCQVPLHEGALFAKEGTYVVVAIPAEDAEHVQAILSFAGR